MRGLCVVGVGLRTCFKQEKAYFVKFWEIQFITSDTVMLKGLKMKVLCRSLRCSGIFPPNSLFLSLVSLLLGELGVGYNGKKKNQEEAS